MYSHTYIHTYILCINRHFTGANEQTVPGHTQCEPPEVLITHKPWDGLPCDWGTWSASVSVKCHGTHRRSGRPWWHSTRPARRQHSQHSHSDQCAWSVRRHMRYMHTYKYTYIHTYIHTYSQGASLYQHVYVGGSSIPGWPYPSSGRDSSVDAPGWDGLASDTGMSIDVTVACS